MGKRLRSPRVRASTPRKAADSPDEKAAARAARQRRREAAKIDEMERTAERKQHPREYRKGGMPDEEFKAVTAGFDVMHRLVPESYEGPEELERELLELPEESQTASTRLDRQIDTAAQHADPGTDDGAWKDDLNMGGDGEFDIGGTD